MLWGGANILWWGWGSHFQAEELQVEEGVSRQPHLCNPDPWQENLINLKADFNDVLGMWLMGRFPVLCLNANCEVGNGLGCGRRPYPFGV